MRQHDSHKPKPLNPVSSHPRLRNQHQHRRQKTKKPTYRQRHRQRHEVKILGMPFTA
ncbi:hypothetical protein M011DRAFT_465305 [Sporormia fimetaria CBS 119925]|uniref:Uncharacterized protein n=1 Tax=Sporormia fimetaria CBS 119925 TaxID=1340428 RepID=A0A6A6VGD4_9PLEO|nr:hypothetical protein M011DRAFT_465305 [Sporormia fimetaria CBS 119925]